MKYKLISLVAVLVLFAGFAQSAPSEEYVNNVELNQENVLHLNFALADDLNQYRDEEYRILMLDLIFCWADGVETIEGCKDTYRWHDSSYQRAIDAVSIAQDQGRELSSKDVEDTGSETDTRTGTAIEPWDVMDISRSGDTHYIEIQDYYDIIEHSEAIDRGEYSFTPVPGGDYYLKVYYEEKDTVEEVDFTAPEVNLDINGPNVVGTDGSVNIDYNYDGGEPFESVSLEGNVASGLGSFDFDDGMVEVSDLSSGIQTIEVDITDSTPGDGLRTSDSTDVRVGDGFTRNLMYPGLSTFEQRQQIRNDWEIYSDENGQLDETEWSGESWLTVSTGLVKGFRLSASDQGTYQKDRVMVKSRLGDDIEEVEFSLRTNDKKGEVLLFDDGYECTSYQRCLLHGAAGKFETDLSGNFKTYRLSETSDGFQLEVDGEDREEMNLDSLNEIAFLIKDSEGESNRLFLEYIYSATTNIDDSTYGGGGIVR